jgi:hypothetical protein
MEECPNCGRPAKDGWVLCPSCGIDLRKAAAALGRDYYVPPGAGPVFTTQTQAPRTTSTPIPIYPSNVWLILLLFGTIPAAIVWTPMAWIGVVLSGIAVHVDAKSLHAGGGQKEIGSTLTWSPFSWALLVLFFWIIGMPLYLYRRRQIWEQSLGYGD